MTEEKYGADKTILIVNESTFASYVENDLNDDGFSGTIYKVSTIDEALNSAGENRPDLAIVAISIIGGYDRRAGIELSKNLSAENIPVIMTATGLASSMHETFANAAKAKVLLHFDDKPAILSNVRDALAIEQDIGPDENDNSQKECKER